MTADNTYPVLSCRATVVQLLYQKLAVLRDFDHPGLDSSSSDVYTAIWMMIAESQR